MQQVINGMKHKKSPDQNDQGFKYCSVMITSQ